MSKTLYTDQQCLDINFFINNVASDVQRLDPETIVSKKDAKARLDNILMGVYNLADEMGIEL